MASVMTEATYVMQAGCGHRSSLRLQQSTPSANQLINDAIR